VPAEETASAVDAGGTGVEATDAADAALAAGLETRAAKAAKVVGMTARSMDIFRFRFFSIIQNGPPRDKAPSIQPFPCPKVF
jgi:hypothetical protein